MEPLTTFSPVNSSDFLTRSFSHYPTVILPQYEFETFDKNSDDVSFPSPNKVTTKIVNNGGGYSPSHESSNIHGVSEGLTGCDCIPLSHCNAKPTYGGITTRIVTKPPPETICAYGLIYCCAVIPTHSKTGCGVSSPYTGVTISEGQAYPGQYPWSAIVLTNSNHYVGGGVLISSNHILTVAHRVVKYEHGENLKVRLGEWDLSERHEPFEYLDVHVSKVVNHPHFDPHSLKNDISIITLATTVPILTKPYTHVNTICLPPPSMIFYGSRCKTAGWGKDQFHGNYQTIIKEVEVPVLSSYDCQSKLRKTKLGNSFTLDSDSFICAGGEAGKDACTGDGGNALACMINGKYYLTGLTAGGIECGNENVPGLYVNVVNYIGWIHVTIKESEHIDPRTR
ncbi:tripsin, putative [Pediculus humanus corporis]|uniref:Tripsin, putative n=1 Tax=Pediculus humanus subsp. corporis TaxID=121224 RepID=E0VLF3_PEDHC|nr:tripsin, putative [Pediculus humanus corporis]EEB14209.1 tripsin, putative [Pediculus humanus corporis]